LKRQFAQILRHILGNEIHIEASVPPRNVPDSFVKKAEGNFGIFSGLVKSWFMPLRGVLSATNLMFNFVGS
jgi:hypothetical protein